MGLRDITLVIHDFGSVLGYQFAYLYPTLVKRLISMDIGMGMLPKGFPADPTPTINELLGYQQVNILSYLNNNNTMMRENVKGMPCGDCASITAKTGWPYYQFIRNGTDRWQTRLGETRSDVSLARLRFLQLGACCSALAAARPVAAEPRPLPPRPHPAPLLVRHVQHRHWLQRLPALHRADLLLLRIGLD
eukprot:COSAG04_NODE_319_length_16893_cov_23.060141_13_plen_191_part_00